MINLWWIIKSDIVVKTSLVILKASDHTFL